MARKPVYKQNSPLRKTYPAQYSTTQQVQDATTLNGNSGSFYLDLANATGVLPNANIAGTLSGKTIDASTITNSDFDSGSIINSSADNVTTTNSSFDSGSITNSTADNVDLTNSTSNGNAIAEVYGGNTVGETDFPVGTMLAVEATTIPDRQADVNPRLNGGDTTSYTIDGADTLLVGTWTSRGAISSSVFLAERVS